MKTRKPCIALIGAEDRNPCGRPSIGQSELCSDCFAEKVADLDRLIESLQSRLTDAQHERYRLQVSVLGG